MHVRGFGLILLAVLLAAGPLLAQDQPPSQTLLIEAEQAATWSEDQTNIIQLEGAVIIEMDQARLSADQAVVWLSHEPGAPLDQQRVEVALLGQATLEHNRITRQGEQLFVTASVRGVIRITAPQRLVEDQSDSELYREAEALRLAEEPQPPPDRPDEPRPEPPRPAPPGPPAPPPPPVEPAAPVQILLGEWRTERAEDGTIVVVISSGVTLMQRRPNGDVIELLAESAVLFTTLTELRELTAVQRRQIEQTITAAYLEGDVRIIQTPAVADLGVRAPPTRPRAVQRLLAERAYYDFVTDRAILTDAVIHSFEPERQIPVAVRARVIRQLALGEFHARRVQLSTSTFATPSYSIAADRAYVRQVDTEDPRYGVRTMYRATHTTFNLYGFPVFYLPIVAGSMTDRGSPLRGVQIESRRFVGLGVLSDWGFFETIGRMPPRDLDIGYSIDYFSERGLAGGVEARYGGGFITETTRDPWNFTGSFTSYFVDDRGTDRLGRRRAPVNPRGFIDDDRNSWPLDQRGRVLLEHQHFFPDDWQVQLRAGLVSDPTFLEFWFREEFENSPPHDVSLYLKRQHNIEALTLLGSFQPNRIVTTSEMLQEQFEIERLPEIGYHRIGQDVLDGLSFTSNNVVSGLRFRPAEASLREQGFRVIPGDPPTEVMPGIPSRGWTGTTTETVYRGDFRQQLDMPIQAGPVQVLPYMLGRVTAYSESPERGPENRLLAGAGVRTTTTFWKFNDRVRSDLFDLNRMRHIIEPEAHFFTSVQTTRRDELFIYDEQIDAVDAITALQLALRQRWQTKRGGPGRWRTSDVFTLNLEANFFANRPPAEERIPVGFRGLFFSTHPEASVARNSLNSDAVWRISDTTALLADAQYNLDEPVLATAAFGLAVRRDPRIAYFVGTRYIEVVNSNITTVAANYELTRKYHVSFAQSFDFGEGHTVSSAATLLRRFDRFFTTFRFTYNAATGESAFTFNLFPEGFGFGLGSDMLPGVFGR